MYCILTGTLSNLCPGTVLRMVCDVPAVVVFAIVSVWFLSMTEDEAELSEG